MANKPTGKRNLLHRHWLQWHGFTRGVVIFGGFLIASSVIWQPMILQAVGEYCDNNPTYCTAVFQSGSLEGYHIRRNVDPAAEGTGRKFQIVNSSGTKYFVPHRTAAEWNAFKTHRPSGVSICEETRLSTETSDGGRTYGCDSCENSRGRHMGSYYAKTSARNNGAHTLGFLRDMTAGKETTGHPSNDYINTIWAGNTYGSGRDDVITIRKSDMKEVAHTTLPNNDPHFRTFKAVDRWTSRVFIGGYDTGTSAYVAQRIAMSSTGSLTPTDKQTRYQQSPVCTPRDIAHSPDASGYGRLYAACTGSFKGIKIHNHNAFHDTGSNTFKTANLSNGSYGPAKIAVSRGGVFAMTSSFMGNTHDRVYVYDTEDLNYHTYINFDTSSNSFSSYKLVDIAIYEGRLYVLMQKASGTINYKVAIYHADMTPSLITEFTLKNSTGGNLTSGCNGVNLCNPHSIAADDHHLYVGDYYYVHKFNNCGTYAAGSTEKSWVRRAWGSCSCPAGTRTRSVTCRNAQGSATSGCSGFSSSSASCTCPRYYTCNTNVGGWSYGSTCSSTYSSCNSGTAWNGQRICCSGYPARQCPYYNPGPHPGPGPVPFDQEDFITPHLQ